MLRIIQLIEINIQIRSPNIVKKALSTRKKIHFFHSIYRIVIYKSA